MKDMAIARLDKELKELKPADQKIKAMKQAVHDALVELLPQVAGRMDMDGSAAQEPKVLKLAALADQRKTM